MQRKWMNAAVLSLSLLLAAAGVAAAHDPDAEAGFSNASLVGTYIRELHHARCWPHRAM